MKLEDQVVSLNLAKQLKKFGLGEGIFFWCEDYHTGGATHYHLAFQGNGIPSCTARVNTYPAFTVAELGELLPRGCQSVKSGDSWGCEWPEKHIEACNCYQPDVRWSEADARARTLIYLIEKNLVQKNGEAK